MVSKAFLTLWSGSETGTLHQSSEKRVAVRLKVGMQLVPLEHLRGGYPSGVCVLIVMVFVRCSMVYVGISGTLFLILQGTRSKHHGVQVAFELLTTRERVVSASMFTIGASWRSVSRQKPSDLFNLVGWHFIDEMIGFVA